MTEAFQWSEVFETGFEEVDKQHRALIGMINAAAPLLAAPEGAPDGEIEALLDRLIGYAGGHFADEETLMASRRLDPDFLAAHVRQHRDFSQEVDSMRRNGTGERRDSLSLLRFLTSWLTFHILGTDQKMVRQIRLVDAGRSPAEAQDATRDACDGAAVPPLLAALTSLYQIVSSRNRALIDVNRSLESKVAARTAELAREKDELASLVKKMELTQSQLLQSEKMASIGQLAAGVAHEINNPVGFVNSNLGTLKTYIERLLAVIDTYAEAEPSLPEDAAIRARLAEVKKKAELDYLREDLGDLLRESQDGLARIRRIVADLKDFSHVGEQEWQHADLNAGIESTLNVVWNEVKYKAEVEKELGELPQVRCLAAQLNQVFMNILVNAAQAIEERGKITIRTALDGEHALIQIADTGKGMPPEVQKRIFEPFFTTKPVGKGTGLGLSIAWDIIRKHDGRLEVDSTPGQGTTFTIRIPLAGPQPAED